MGNPAYTKDITAIFYTSNFVENKLTKSVRAQLLQALGEIPLISVSQKPMDFGTNICVGDIGRSHLNIYKQILIGTKAAKTKYVAMTEDDILYHPSHFISYRPKPGMFAYNFNKWSIYSWSNPPIFSFHNRRVVNSLIAERDMLIEALEERFAKFPDETKIPLKWWGDPGKYERQLGVKERPTEEFHSWLPNVVFSHENAYGYLLQGNRKRLGPIRAIEIEYWGTAQQVMDRYYRG